MKSHSAMPRLRVLHFFKTFLPDTYGGVEQVIHQLALKGGAHGIDSEVLTLSRSAKTEPSIDTFGYRISRCPYCIDVASTPISATAVFRFLALVKTVDVVHLHFPWPFSDLVSLLSKHGKPVVVTYHADIIKQRRLLMFYRPLMNALFRSASCIVATSPNYVEGSQTLRQWREKVRVIPIGIDRNSYPQVDPSRVAAWEKRLGKTFFLFIGVFRYYKGVENLLEAVREQTLSVALVGSGGQETELRRHAAGLDGKQVHFLGKLDENDKVALLSRCAALVLPSIVRSEAFGISLLEGAMFGKPLISCEIGTGTSYVNIDGETGLVVEPCNPEALRRAMHYILDHPDEAETMGRNARRRYETFFTADRMCAEYGNLYRALAVEKVRPARLSG